MTMMIMIIAISGSFISKKSNVEYRLWKREGENDVHK